MSYNEEKKIHLAQSIFIDCAIISKESLVILMVDDNIEIDIWEDTPPVSIYTINYKDRTLDWKRSRFKANIFAFPMIERVTIDDYLLVDNVGGVFYRKGINSIPEKNIRINGEIRDYSGFKGLKNIHGTIYLVGNFRQVIRRNGKNIWSDISEGKIQEEAKKRYHETFALNNKFEAGFNTIDGFEADNELYVAGNGSDVWRYHKKNWIPIDIGVLGEDIISICCAENGFVYLSTAKGKLIKGRNNSWKEIETPFDRNHPIIDIAYFKEKIYLATANRLYEYDNNKITSVNYHTEDGLVPRKTGSLDVSYGYLLSVGDQSIALYDGTKWEILYGSAEEDFQSFLDDYLEKS